MGRTPATFAKREREKKNREKRQAKLALRAERRAQKAQRPKRAAGEPDPDLAGIRAGPQLPRRD
jgi:hypothetical protein